MLIALYTGDKWVKQLEKVVHLRGKLYLLPGGAVGQKVVSVYADEIKRFGNGEQKCVKHILFSAFDVNHGEGYKKPWISEGFLTKRIQLWEDRKYDVMKLKCVIKCDQKEARK